MVAVGHEGICHARHRMMRVTFTPAVAGGLYAHETRIHAVLQIADENAVLDENVALRGRTLVIDRDGAAPVGDRAVINDGHAFRGDLLADETRKSRRTLAVEIAF